MRRPRPLGISSNAACRLRHKLRQVLRERDAAYLGGERSGGERGRGAPGQTPFVAAVEPNEAGPPQGRKLPVITGFRRTEIATWAQPPLNAGTRVVSDGLACFHGVSAAGGAHDKGVGRRASRRRAARVSMGQHDSR